MTDDPSLLRFVQEQLDDEIQRIILNTPVFWGADHHPSPELEAMVDRWRLIHRVRRDRAVVDACVAAVQSEQGDPPVVPPMHPATNLGDEVIKLIALTYQDHPDFNQAWQPRQLPGV